MDIDIPKLSVELLRGVIGVVSGTIIGLVVYRLQSRAEKEKYEARLKQQQAMYKNLITSLKRTLIQIAELVDDEERAREKALKESEITKYLDDPESIERLSEMFNLLHQGGGGDVPELEVEGPALSSRILIVAVISVTIIIVNILLGLSLPFLR